MLMGLVGPKGLCLTRQNVPVLEGTAGAAREGVVRGGYVLAEASTGTPEVLLIGTGWEAQLAGAARHALEAGGSPTRGAPNPCVQVFGQPDTEGRLATAPSAPPTARRSRP